MLPKNTTLTYEAFINKSRFSDYRSGTDNEVFHDNTWSYENRVLLTTVYRPLVQAHGSFNLTVRPYLYIPDMTAIDDLAFAVDNTMIRSDFL